MSVFKVKGRDLWAVKWSVNGKQNKKYFKSQNEAHAYEAERIAAEVGGEEKLTLGELAMLYFRSNPEFHRDTKRKIVYFLAGHEKDGQAH